uniref:Ig-like domain-containing protein n=1 Tax=Sinocyclocheilus rhinocerous TaxID=307959 RepID=A0A673IJX7_9TELE
MCINTERPKPVVKVTPDQRVFRGETVTLTCDIQRGGNFQWTYSWFKDGSVIRHFTERVYTITSVSDNSGEYSCRGERSDSQRSDTSAAVTLTVSARPKPVVKVRPDQRVFRGETVTLTCDIQRGGNFQWTYSWFKDGSVIRRVTERVYTITSLSDNSGEYSCRGERSDSQRSHISAAVTLTVSGEPKPVVKVSPDQRVFRGETVTLTCDIQRGGNFQWTYSWFKDGSVIRRVTERVYTITSLSDNSGEYSCRGERSDSQRSDTSAAVTLTVSDLPRSTLTVTPNSPVFTGERVSLKCVINPDHSNWRYEWYKGSTKVSEHHTVKGNTLTIERSKTSDAGRYTCKGHIDGRSVSSQSSSPVYLSVTGEFNIIFMILLNYVNVVHYENV